MITLKGFLELTSNYQKQFHGTNFTDESFRPGSEWGNIVLTEEFDPTKKIEEHSYDYFRSSKNSTRFVVEYPISTIESIRHILEEKMIPYYSTNFQDPVVDTFEPKQRFRIAFRWNHEENFSNFIQQFVHFSNSMNCAVKNLLISTFENRETLVFANRPGERVDVLPNDKRILQNFKIDRFGNLKAVESLIEAICNDFPGVRDHIAINKHSIMYKRVGIYAATTGQLTKHKSREKTIY